MNIQKITEIVKTLLGIIEEVHIVPMRFKMDENAYSVNQGGQLIIYVNPKILEKDKISDFNIKLFIHELTHIKQLMDGRLKFNYDNTKAIYDGVEYTNLTAYGDRPFEQEARKAEGIYFKQVKKLL